MDSTPVDSHPLDSIPLDSTRFDAAGRESLVIIASATVGVPTRDTRLSHPSGSSRFSASLNENADAIGDVSRRHRTRLCKAAYEAHCNYQCLETLRITSTYRDLSLRAQTRRRAMRKRLKTAKGVSSIIGCGPPAAVASEAPRPGAVLHMHCPRTGSKQKRRTAADA